MLSPYRQPEEPPVPPSPRNKLVEFCVMICVVGIWSVFITHLGSALWRNESLLVYVPLGLVLVSVSVFLVGATTGDDGRLSR